MTACRGTLVKTVGDGIMAAFASAADAVAAAVAIQQAVDRHNRRAAATRLDVRVGISVGDVRWEEGDCFGTPVVEAARLCSEAAGGQILAAEVVRLLTHGRGGHRFVSVGQLALKGLEPTAACEVLWEPCPETDFPLPPRLGIPPAIRFVGRTAEQEVLSLALAKARDGQRQVVLLAGEPGIGKTRLATEVALAAHAEGAVVLLGNCDEDVGAPYRPLVEALRHYVTHAPADVLTAHVRAHKGELTRMVPDLARRLPDLPPPQVAEAETERYLMFEAATALLAAASREHPVVLVLEDLHWAGAPELRLLKHLVQSPEPMRLLVIGTYRDSDLTRVHPLTAVLADLRRESGVERLRLGGLDDDAVVALVAAAAGHALTEAGVALAQALRRETEGNPFFIAEILRNLVESGAVLQKRGRWTYTDDVAALGIPESVREVIGRRLGRLSDATGKLLCLAAVIGRQFELALLVRFAKASEDIVLDGLDEATAAALVAEVPGAPGQFAFSHALIRTTLYEELGAARRARLHRGVGEALEELTREQPESDDRVNELAYHWLQATQPAEMGKAIGYARQAADRALAGLAFEEAAGHYERALGALVSRDRNGDLLRCDLLLALGDAQRRAGDVRYRETVAKAAEMARALGDGGRLGLAALGSARPGGWMASATVVDQGLIALYEEALAALGSADSLLRARLLGQLAVELVYSPQRDRRHALSREAVEVARRLGDRAGLAQVLVLRLLAVNDPFTLAERLTLTTELGTLAGELRSAELHYLAAFHRTGALLESGDAAAAERALAECQRFASELRQPFYAWFAHMGRTMFSIMRGLPEAEQEAFAVFGLGMASGQPDAPAGLGAELAFIRLDQGRADELVDAVRANVEAMPHMPVWRAALAMIYAETERPDEAREQIGVLGASDPEAPLNWTWGTYVSVLSLAIAELRDTSAAAVLYERVQPIAGQANVLVVVLLSTGSYGLPAGMLASCLGRWDEAESHFEQALVTNQRLGARSFAVRTRRAWAAMLLDRNAPGDAARAAELIAAGLAEAEALGMGREVRRLRELQQHMAPLLRA